MRRFQLRTHVYQARQLPAMDEDGLCNPYVVVTLAGFAGHTRVVLPTSDPQVITVAAVYLYGVVAAHV